VFAKIAFFFNPPTLSGRLNRSHPFRIGAENIRQIFVWLLPLGALFFAAIRCEGEWRASDELPMTIGLPIA
jgi:hypothetical protein